jgi:hypothetical protein
MAIVSTIGACGPVKIAAISAEIAARVALDAARFKSGDTGHRQ